MVKGHTGATPAIPLKTKPIYPSPITVRVAPSNKAAAAIDRLAYRMTGQRNPRRFS